MKKQPKPAGRLEAISRLLDAKKQVVLYGPAGTGKTHAAKKTAVEYILDRPDESEAGRSYAKEFNILREEGRVAFVTFHQSYSYRDFIEGYAGSDAASLTSGIFKGFCARALAWLIGAHYRRHITWRDIYSDYQAWALRHEVTSDLVAKSRFVFVIDEINRGHVADIFGELVSLLDADKRLGMENELVTTLPYSRDLFSIPPNVFILGTMTVSARRTALADPVLRRRFGFFEIAPGGESASELLSHHAAKGTSDLVDESIKKLLGLNERIAKDPSLGRGRQVGHVALYGVKSGEDLRLVWEGEILPLLEEYCEIDYVKMNKLLFKSDKDTQWITKSEGVIGIPDIEEFVKNLA